MSAADVTAREDYVRFISTLRSRRPTLVPAVWYGRLVAFDSSRVELSFRHRFESERLASQAQQVLEELKNFFGEEPRLHWSLESARKSAVGVRRQARVSATRQLEIPATWRLRLEDHGFSIEERLGRGAYGTVYRARQESLARDVAVKFYETSFMTSEASRQRFRREAMLLARVEHPAVPFVVTKGAVPDDGTPYHVMQFIRGEPLGVVLRRHANGMAPQECRAAYSGHPGRAYPHPRVRSHSSRYQTG